MLLTKTFFLALSIAAVAASLYAATRRRPGLQRPFVWTPGLDLHGRSQPRQQDNGRLAASVYDVPDAEWADAGALDLGDLPADAPEAGPWRRLRTG